MKEQPEHQRSRPLDQFRGATKLRDLSLRLMDWYVEPVSDGEIVEALGPEILPAFRYAQERLAGKVRKVTLEPSFCHSADIAFRAYELGYSAPTVTVGLLHDLVEETCATIADVPAAVGDLAARFDDETVRSVLLLTNRYQLIFKGFAQKVSQSAPFESRTRRAYRAALDVLNFELPLDITERFDFEFHRLAEFLDSRANLADGARIARRDKKFTVATYLERKVYSVYVDELVSRATAEVTTTAYGHSIMAVVVKLLDLTDNIRTNEISNRLSLFKLMNKAETLLDRIRDDMLQAMPGDALAPTTIPPLHRLVQVRLVDQLAARHRAVSDNFAETRFAGLIDFLAQQTARLREKYDVPDDCVDDISQLEDVIRATNRSRAHPDDRAQASDGHA